MKPKTIRVDMTNIPKHNPVLKAKTSPEFFAEFDNIKFFTSEELLEHDKKFPEETCKISKDNS